MDRHGIRVNADTKAATGRPLTGMMNSLRVNPRLSDWMALTRDGKVIVSPGKVEIGQGILTVLQQVVADELQVAPERVILRPASTTFSPDEGVTSGSLSVQDCAGALAQVSAEVRFLLLECAAARLGCEPAILSVKDGEITGPRNVHSSYWELVDNISLDRAATGVVSPRPVAERMLIGRSMPRIDIPGRIFGTRPYIHDLQLPEMLHGRILRSEFTHAKLKSLDASAVEATEGFVALVRDGNFIGVLTETESAAERAIARLARAAVWEKTEDLPEVPDHHNWLRSQPFEARVIDTRGHTEVSGRTFVREYSRPYLAHASVGPSCALAQWENGMLHVMTHSQGIYNLRAELALFFDMTPEAIVVEHLEGAGCYGHNGADDIALEAAILARSANGRPVRLQWTRQEELTAGPFGAAQLVRIEARLDNDNRPAAWRHTIWSNGHTARPGRAETPALRAANEIANPWPRFIPVDPPQAAGGGADRNSIPLYDFPAWEIVHNRLLTVPLRTSSLRSLGAYANVFAIESFMDELAADADIDPLAWRLALLSDPRAEAVLRSVAAQADWDNWTTTEGTGRGLAVARYKSRAAYCAAVAEVEVEEDVRVRRLYLTVDVGDVVNPDGVRNQIEGGAIQAVSWALKEQVRFDRDRIISEDWESYPILRFSEVPEVTVEILPRSDQPSLGAGECAQGPVVGAIGNAIADALGVRIRRLPFSRENLIQAMELN